MTRVMMWRRSAWVIGVALMFGCGDTTTQDAQAPTAVAPPGQTDTDPGRLARAPIVLRVTLVEADGGSKYHWDQVRPIRVIKNASSFTFDAPLRVAHYGWHGGVPSGISTIYLEAYGGGNANLWKLLDGDGAIGVSHAVR
jgi:hypothetical protein